MTPRKPYAKEDRNALAEARRHTQNALSEAQRLIERLEAMRETPGRPDLSPLERRIGKLAVSLAAASAHLGEMDAIRRRVTSPQPESDAGDLTARVTRLETAISQILNQRTQQHTE